MRRVTVQLLGTEGPGTPSPKIFFLIYIYTERERERGIFFTILYLVPSSTILPRKAPNLPNQP